MKTILSTLLAISSINAFALVGDSGQISFVYVSNTSGENVQIVSGNPYNDSGFSKFRCLYQVPQAYQDLPSPSFKTLIEPNNKNSRQYATIPKGTSVAFAFDSTCDNLENADAIEIRSAADFSKLYISGTLNQNAQQGIYTYHDRIRISALTSDVLGSGIFAPFQFTVLPIKK